MDLAGKRALVTAGAKRIGRGICEALAAAGARVAIHYRSSEAEARETAKACPGAIVLQADLTGGSAACRDLIERAETGLGGGLDVLVNNAAVYERLALDEIDDAAWDRHLDLNLKATFFLALHAGLGMRDRGAGAIVNLGLILLSTPKMVSTMIGASPSDGSSRSSRLGLAISALPIASICCSPPLKLPAC